MNDLNWRNVVQSERERRMFIALEDPRWDWRTVPSLARASGMSEGQTRAAISRYPQLIRRSRVPSASGEDLYTLQSRYYERKSPLEKGWDFLSSSSS